MAILDTLDVIKNLQDIHDNDKAFQVLKDFERVIDNLGIYVFDNWEEGELAAGPHISRHWVKCSFMWPRKNMPDPAGGKILLDYGCKISFEKSHIIKAREIRKPDDIRPGTKKGKLDKLPVWIVEIKMPKSLILDVYSGDKDLYNNDEKEESISPAPTPAPNIAPAGGTI
jgi:hypothetical protein